MGSLNPVDASVRKSSIRFQAEGALNRDTLTVLWVQVWVQLKEEKWLPISRKRHQIEHLDFQSSRLLTERLQSSPHPGAFAATVLGRNLRSLIEFVLQLPLKPHKI